MKKTARGLLLAIFIAVLAFTLAGCGNKNKNEEEHKASTIVATKIESDSYFGEYKETMDIRFMDNIAETICITYDFANEETAKGITSLFSLAGPEQLQGIEINQNGTKCIMTLNSKTYAEQHNIEEGSLSREYFLTTLGEGGYEIQE
jgi:uncharacterized lipoprotein YehR (DUF1307 family)